MEENSHVRLTLLHVVSVHGGRIAGSFSDREHVQRLSSELRLKWVFTFPIYHLILI